jgi:LPS-assembly lipoprotein
MSKFFPLILSGGILLSLSACGFQPMYGTHAAAPSATGETAEAALADIEISNIPDRSGLYLRNALIDRFYANGAPSAPRYILNVSPVVERKRDLDLTKSAEATRYQLYLSTTLTLTDTRNPSAPVLTRALFSTNSYNALESEFATRVTEDSARLSGLNDLARQIELNLALFLNRTHQ